MRSLRDSLVQRGWTTANDLNWPTAVSRDERVAIAVASGDENTGRPNRTPSTRRVKGPKTLDAVYANAEQLWLFDDMAPKAHRLASTPPVTWILLFFSSKSELRAELSLPIRSRAGKISSWQDRIILPSQPIELPINVAEPDFGPDIDIKIERRA